MFEPFDITLAVERIKPLAPSLRRVAAALDLTAAETDAGVLSPAAYVIPVAEIPRPHQGGAGAIRQVIGVEFGVAILVRNVRAIELGVASWAALRTAIAEVRGALFGWSALGAGNCTSCELGRAERRVYDNGTVWWLESFRFEHWFTKTT